MKRFSVNLTDEEYKELKEASKRHNRSMTATLRAYLGIGIRVDRKGSNLILKEDGKDIHIIIV